MPAGPASLLDDPPEEERRPRAKPWVSPWSLDDEWDDVPLQPEPQLRVVAAERPRAMNPPPKAVPVTLASPPKLTATSPPSPMAVTAKAANGAGPGNVVTPSAAAAPVPVSPPVKASPPPPVTVPAPLPTAQPLAPAPSASPPVIAADAAPLRVPNQKQQRTATRQRAPIHRPAFSWAGPIIVSIGLLALTFLAWVYWQDAPVEADDDLRLNLPVDQTMAISAPRRMRAFLDSVRTQGRPEREESPWDWSTPVLSDFVTSHGSAFDNLRDLLEDYDWHPRHPSWFASDLGSDPTWPEAALLLEAQAAYLVRRGDEESAFTTAIDMAEFSRRLQDLWAWPSFAARSFEMHTACTQTLAELLKRTRLDSARLAPFQKEFAECVLSRAVLQDALSAYYLHEKKLLLGSDSGEPLETMPYLLAQKRPGRLFFKTHQTLHLFAGAFRELKAEVSAPPNAAFSFAGDRARRTRQTKPQFYQPNATGERYFSDRIDIYLDLPELLTLAEARHRLVLCFFAVRRHLADHQRLPQGLSELKPSYLATIPLDPFSGESPHYDTLKGRLYSVGVNRIDEGGVVGQMPLSEPREPTLELGVAPAAVVK